ncbi:hypothetical protein CI109_102515 [Kwoniella shandongensis]|uniref:Uncharacterized protein n=1 Tax=Kwoniella shandongensis TaxID=1734106 RepID=A0A5M6C508_9TREE|nr:uncharacterized protein CI109_003167 [Kwoniella shandongensis]KAA5528269.1 hypothetical protein CI109_003167 [Kwoniella shandongensis]
MEVVTEQVHLLSAAYKGNALPIPLQSTSTGRSRIDTTNIAPKDSLRLYFSSASDEKIVGEVEVNVAGGRKLRSRGWERLRVRADSASKGVFCAYRLWRRSGPTPINTILIFLQPDTANFLSHIPDNTPLGDLTLPGTHESCALYGYPISQCQQPSTPIEQQLLDGIRFLDVRLRVVGDELLMYHGPRPQRSSLTLLLAVIHNFLLKHPSETLILCLKEETPPFHPHFSSLVYKAFKPHIDQFWFLEERIPTLGEVRGKGMLMTRFDRDKTLLDGESKGYNSECGEEWPAGMGIHPLTWPDSRQEGFEWDCNGTTVRTQDWYRVKTFLSIPEKLEAIVNHLTPTLTPSPSPKPPFTLSYTSASYFPLSFPTVIAKGFGFPSWGFGVEGINSRLCRWLLEILADEHQDKRIRGCLPIDFYRQCAGDEGLAGLLVQMNFVEW